MSFLGHVMQMWCLVRFLENCRLTARKRREKNHRYLGLKQSFVSVKTFFFKISFYKKSLCVVALSVDVVHCVRIIF